MAVQNMQASDNPILLSAMPGGVAGLVIGILFVFFSTNITINTAEDVMIAGLCTLLFPLLFGLISHFLGHTLQEKAIGAAGQALFGGDLGRTGMMHSALWGVVLVLSSVIVLSINQVDISVVRKSFVVLKAIMPDQKPISKAVPSFPGGSRGARNAAATGAQEDPNKFKSSPSRFDGSGKLVPGTGSVAEQETARNEMVVDTFKSAGLKVEGVFTEAPRNLPQYGSGVAPKASEKTPAE